MTSWRAEFTGPNAMNAAATFGAWTDAADWLAAMLRVVQPERGYLEAARALTGAIPGQAFLAPGGRPYATPPVLDAVADVVLAYRPKPKSRAGKARKRRAAKIAREKPRA